MVALITGGAKGIGKELSIYLLETGNTVYVNYLTSDVSAKALERVYPSSKVIITNGDITNEDYVRKLMKQIKKEQGKLDLLINNACYCCDDLIGDKTKESFVKELDTNLVAPFLLAKYYHEEFESGMIINMLSTDGVDTYNEYNMGYAASKAGLLNLTNSLAYSLKNFKVYGLMLNYVNTSSVLDMNPDFLNNELKRIGQKELIEKKTVSKHFEKLIQGNLKSGYIERVDSNE